MNQEGIALGIVFWVALRVLIRPMRSVLAHWLLRRGYVKWAMRMKVFKECHR